MPISLFTLTTLLGGVLLGALFVPSKEMAQDVRRWQPKEVARLLPRLLALAGGFYLCAGLRTLPLLLCLLGFVLARLEVHRINQGQGAGNADGQARVSNFSQ